MDLAAPAFRERVFQELVFIDDTEPRPVELQMAVDEALLETTKLPVLRVYRWAATCVTIGYFESHADATLRHPGMPVVRRWTGGGKVVHEGDAPYSLIVPKCEPFAGVRPTTAYRLIHSTLAETLRGRFPEIALAIQDAPKQSAACFENPVVADLLCGSQKVGGAGQRRTRLGLLHQGCLQLDGRPFRDAHIFASHLAHVVSECSLSAKLLTTAEHIAAARYQSADWNRDRARP